MSWSYDFHAHSTRQAIAYVEAKISENTHFAAPGRAVVAALNALTDYEGQIIHVQSTGHSHGGYAVHKLEINQRLTLAAPAGPPVVMVVTREAAADQLDIEDAIGASVGLSPAA